MTPAGGHETQQSLLLLWLNVEQSGPWQGICHLCKGKGCV